MTFESKRLDKSYVYNSEKSVINSRIGKKVQCQKPRNRFKEVKEIE